MGIQIYNQLSAAKSIGKGPSWRLYAPLLSVHKSFLRRRTFGRSFSVKAATPTQARRAGIAGKSSFVEPKWLLAVEGNARESATDKISPDESVFQVVLTTSSDYGSGISDLNAGILLAFIGEEGRCFIHRVPTQGSSEAVETIEQTGTSWKNRPSYYRFQRGSQDQVSFCGPELGQLEAVWVAPEKSTWKMKGVRVSVFPKHTNKEENNVIEDSRRFLQYDFVCEEFLLGENDDSLAAELIPSMVTEIPLNSRQPLLDSEVTIHGLQKHLDHQVRYKGIKEYEALKFSLLRYDAILVAIGSALTAATGHKEAAEGFLVGGLVGFLYLFVLEKTVDQLPAPSTFPSSLTGDDEPTVRNSTKSGKRANPKEANENNTTLFEKQDWLPGSLDGFRGPLTKFSGILAVILLILKYLNSANNQAISKDMLLAGVAGFLMTKFAALLASNVPISAQQPPSSEKGG